MSNGEDWYDTDKKRAAIARVLQHIVANPTVGQNCVGKDSETQKLFEDPKIGNIRVPTEKGARAIIFASGEKQLKAGSSVIIELPGPDVTPASKPSDQELFKFVLGNYAYW